MYQAAQRVKLTLHIFFFPGHPFSESDLNYFLSCVYDLGRTKFFQDKKNDIAGTEKNDMSHL